MALFPVEPHLSRSILASSPTTSSSSSSSSVPPTSSQGCTKELLTITSVISSSSKLFLDISTSTSTSSSSSTASARIKFKHPSGDHLTILNTVRAYDDISSQGSKHERKEWCKKHCVNERALTEAKKIREQLVDVCRKLGLDPELSCGENEGPVLASLGYGLVGNSAFLQPDGSYKQTMGHSIIKIHPGSTMMNEKVPAIIYDELVYTNQIYARGVSAIGKNFFVKHPALSQRQA